MIPIVWPPDKFCFCWDKEKSTQKEVGVYDTKKAGRIPVRNICRSRQEPAQETQEKRPARHKDTMVLAGIFLFLGKKDRLKLGGFTDVFC